MLKRLILLTLFAISMAFLESAVVVYLRALYYPEGFAFPLKLLKGPILLTELIREAATMVMLITVSMMADRRRMLRFAWFIYMFAIWDIFYYVFLWLILGWPESLLTWDLLFLIPVSWVGPVLAPVINSFTMILLAGVIISADGRTAGRANGRTGGQADVRTGGQADRRTGGPVRLTGLEWSFLIIGSLITIMAYIEEYSRYMLERFSFGEWFSLSNQAEVLAHAGEFIPAGFPWWLFITGEVLFVIAIFFFWNRNLRRRGKFVPAFSLKSS